MGKIIDKIRARERRMDGRRITEAERERIQKLREQYRTSIFWRLVDRLRGRSTS